MEKKEYIKPEMKVYQIETPSILAGSELKKGTKDDYGDDKVSKLIEDESVIYID